MENGLEVPVAVLRKAAEVLLDRVEEVAGDSVMLDVDMFWEIPSGARAKVYEEPREFTIGQLSESLVNIQQVVRDPSDAVSFGLVWLADLLRAIGEQIVE